MSWEKNISEICKKAYSRVKMLSKLKYVGTKKKDLILLYCLHIRSITEYCSTAFHSSLTLKQANKLESIQKTCLRIILGEDYISYESALISTNLLSLKQRREKKEISFALKCTKHPTNSTLFPINPSLDPHVMRNREPYMVNQARTETYRISAIPHLQRRLNTHFLNTSKTHWYSYDISFCVVVRWYCRWWSHLRSNVQLSLPIQSYIYHIINNL